MRKRTLIGWEVVLGVAGMWTATQYTAWQLAFAPALGWGWPIRGFRLYAPWSVVVWMGRYADRLPGAFDRAYMVLASTAIVMVLIAVLTRPKSPFRVRVLGQDRWATKGDMQAAGLFAGTGVVVGEYRGIPLVYDGPEHQLVSGASRSGKGVGHVVPTLLTWPRSALVYDIKNELYPLTAGWRSKLGPTLCFNPTRRDSAHFNPLLEIRKGAQEIRDAQNVAEMLVNPDGAKKTLDIWDTKAAELLVAVILHVLYSAPDHQKHLGTVRDKLLSIEHTCRDMAETQHLFDKRTGEIYPHPEVARVAKDLLAKYQKFRDSVTATAGSYLTLYADPIIAEMTSTSDFRLSDLMCAEKPVTLFLQPPPSDAPRLRPLVRLILSQVCRVLMEDLSKDHSGRAKSHRLLLLLDEFPTLGKLEFFSLNMRQMAGYGLKAHLIVQSFNDILEAYGPNNTIIDNCHLLTAFASADTTTCQRISQMSGTVTEYRPSYSEPRPRWGFGRRSISYAEQVRPLLPPGDIRELSSDDQLIFVTGHKPMRVRKLRYYQSRYFRPRLLTPPDPGAVRAALKIVASEWFSEKPKGARVPLEVQTLRSNIPPSRRPVAMPLFDPADTARQVKQESSIRDLEDREYER